MQPVSLRHPVVWAVYFVFSHYLPSPFGSGLRPPPLQRLAPLSVETSPLGCVGALRKRHEGIAGDALLDLQQLQGRPVYGSEVAVTDDAGVRVPKDGTSTGNLMVRGPWIASGYYRHDEDVLENGSSWTARVPVSDVFGFHLRICEPEPRLGS